MNTKGKYIYDWPRPMVTVDAAVFTHSSGKTKVLLIKRGREPYKGKWAVPGGFVNMDEELEDAVVRELEEETGLTPQYLEHVGELAFVFTDGYSLYGYVFFAFGYEGSITETDEADPFWCSISEIPYDRMWEDDIAQAAGLLLRSSLG